MGLYKPSRGPGDDESRNPAAEPAATEARPDLRATGGTDAPEVMNSLPHRRPHRRSARRAAEVQRPARPVRVIHGGGEEVPDPPRARLRAADGGRSGTPPRHRGGNRKASARRRAELRRPPEPAPGIARLALDGALAATKLPVRLGAHLTTGALDSLTRALRPR